MIEVPPRAVAGGRQQLQRAPRGRASASDRSRRSARTGRGRRGRRRRDRPRSSPDGRRDAERDRQRHREHEGADGEQHGGRQALHARGAWPAAGAGASVPKSPRRSFFTNRQYWTWSGWSSPSARVSASTSSREGSARQEHHRPGPRSDGGPRRRASGRRRRRSPCERALRGGSRAWRGRELPDGGGRAGRRPPAPGLAEDRCRTR